MHLTDILYGDFEIQEPVLCEILKSPELLRLKNISNGGYYPAWSGLPSIEKLNRYDHSVGVFLLLRLKRARLEEQIAGLIHDLSHSAFSHTIDYLKKDTHFQKIHCAQDDFHNEYILKSSVANTLKKHGFNVEYILDETHFSLLENKLPEICADRIDYSLRQAVATMEIDTKQKEWLLNELITTPDSFAFKSFKSAQFFANLFWNLDASKWSNIPTAIMFHTSATLLNEALKLNIIQMTDLYQDGDLKIIEKIKKNLDKSSVLANSYAILQTNPSCFESNPNKNAAPTFCKVRRVNPLFFDTDGTWKHLTEKDADYAVRFQSAPLFTQYHLWQKET